MIAIDPEKGNTTAVTDKIVNDIISDIKSSVTEKDGEEVYYPGELELKNIEENLKNGIPVIKEKWDEVCNL